MLILQGPDHPVEGLTFSPDSTTLYVVQGHHGIRSWNIIANTADRVEYDGKLLVGQFVFDPTGRWVLSATAHTSPTDRANGRLIDFTTGKTHRLAAESKRDNSAFLAGNRIVAIGSSWVNPKRRAGVAVHAFCGSWALRTDGLRSEWQFDFPGNEQPLFLASLGDLFATAEIVGSASPTYLSQTWDMRLTVHRGSDGAVVRELPYPHRYAQQLLAAPDGSRLVARLGTELHVWNAANWHSAPRVVPGSHPDVQDEEYWRLQRSSAAAFHPSGRYLLLACNDASVIAFDTSSWQVAHRWEWDAGPLQACAVSPDGTLAATGSTNGTVVVWDLDL